MPLHLNILRRSQTPTNPPSPQRTVSTSSSPAASPNAASPNAASPNTASLNSASLPASPISVASTAIPNRDPLPLSSDALEGLLNARASQLQKLADRIECVNEWLEMDGIVLTRLVIDVCLQVDKEDDAIRASEEAAERAHALWKENNPYGNDPPAATKGPVSPKHYRKGAGNKSSTGSPRSSSGGASTGSGSRHGRHSSGESRVPEVYLKNPFLMYGRKTKDERVDDNCGVRDLRERIKAMMKWRREIERTVCWQREEYRRVLKALHRQSEDESSARSAAADARRVVQFEVDDDDEEEGEGVEGKGKGKGKGKEKENEGPKEVKKTGVEHDEGWGVGGQTWQKKRGRVPSQAEWEELFSDGKLSWDDKGASSAVRRRYLGC